jgi:germination protein M
MAKLPMKAAAVSLLLMTALTACNVWDGSESIDPPQSMGKAKEQVTMAGVGKDKPLQVTVYLKDNRGYVAPVTMGMADTDTPAKAALEAMVDGAPMPSGFHGLLPKGTTVKGINLVKEEKLAVVDFSKSFLTYNKADERKLLEAVTWTMTGFPSIEQIQLRVDGKAVETMPASNTPVSATLSRKMGINIEGTSGSLLTQSHPATLYFQSKDVNGLPYYVPVTRMIAGEDKTLEAVVKQLAVPPAGSALEAVVSDDIEAAAVQVQNDVVTVNLKDAVLKKATDLDASTWQAVVMTMLGNSSAKQVQVMVNDKAHDVKPVSMPTNINPIGL